MKRIIRRTFLSLLVILTPFLLVAQERGITLEGVSQNLNQVMEPPIFFDLFTSYEISGGSSVGGKYLARREEMKSFSKNINVQEVVFVDEMGTQKFIDNVILFIDSLLLSQVNDEEAKEDLSLVILELLSMPNPTEARILGKALLEDMLFYNFHKENKKDENEERKLLINAANEILDEIVYIGFPRILSASAPYLREMHETQRLFELAEAGDMMMQRDFLELIVQGFTVLSKASSYRPPVLTDPEKQAIAEFTRSDAYLWFERKIQSPEFRKNLIVKERVYYLTKGMLFAKGLAIVGYNRGSTIDKTIYDAGTNLPGAGEPIIRALRTYENDPHGTGKHEVPKINIRTAIAIENVLKYDSDNLTHEFNTKVLPYLVNATTDIGLGLALSPAGGVLKGTKSLKNVGKSTNVVKPKGVPKGIKLKKLPPKETFKDGSYIVRKFDLNTNKLDREVFYGKTGNLEGTKVYTKRGGHKWYEPNGVLSEESYYDDVGNNITKEYNLDTGKVINEVKRDGNNNILKTHDYLRNKTKIYDYSDSNKGIIRVTTIDEHGREATENLNTFEFDYSPD